MRNLLKLPFIGLCGIILLISVFQGCMDEQSSLPDDMIVVSLDGTGDYRSIQRAIEDNSTLENSTIYVYNGEYKENIFINKTIKLIGEDPRSTIINANKTADGIRINADNVNISGFTIINIGGGQGFPDMNAGIDIASNHNNISDCRFINITIGIYSTRATDNTITTNEFDQCSNYGMYITTSDRSMIKNNIFSNNDIGLRIKGSRESVVSQNLFINNIKGMYFCCNAQQNLVFHNTFINNTYYHADDQVGNNQWSNEEIQEGNYWDTFNSEKHQAFDNNSDGIIDTFYVIREDNIGTPSHTIISDNFPLAEPYITHRNLF